METGGQGGKFAGRVVLISGGAQGIGRAIAERFHSEHACVALLDCDVTAGAETARQLSSRRSSSSVIFLQADLSDPNQITRAIEELNQRHGRIDVLINNAGIELDKTIGQISVCEWDHILNVNLRGAFLLTQGSLPLFPQVGGAIVNVSSIHATHAFPHSIPYACSKAALIALTRNLALDLAPRKIRVNAICPGYIDTRLWDNYVRQMPDPETVAAATASLHPVGRRGQPADVAEAALFLASEGSGFITGTTLVIDGGLTVRAHP